VSPDPHSGSPGDDAAADTPPDDSRDCPEGNPGPFAAGQPLDAASAGPELAAALADAQKGFGTLSDDALAGFLGACQKITAWTAAMLLDGIAEFATRRPDDGTPGRAVVHAAAVEKARAALAAGQPADPPGYDEFAPDELMPVLRLSKGAAARQVELAVALRYRLRATHAAMLEGRIDLMRARIIAEATADLSAADAAAVEALVLGRAGRQTYIALGMAVGKAVLYVDPKGAMRRRKRAEKRARVERWRETDGTGALCGRNLPPDDTLAADQALTALALELRSAGLDGPLDYLRATALIDQITGRDSRPAAGPDEHDAGEPGTAEPGTGQPGPPEPGADADEDWDNRDDWPAMDAWLLSQHDLRDQQDLPDQGSDGSPGDAEPGRHDDGPGRQDGDGSDSGGGGTRPPAGPGGPRGPGGPGQKRQAPKRPGKRVAAWINLTIPLATLLKLGHGPGDAGPFGPLDPAAARDVARAAAAHPGTRWCLTVTDQRGRAMAHGCARGPKCWTGLEPRASPGARDGPAEDGLDPRTVMARFLSGLGITLNPIATTGCDHRDAEPGYTPSRKLRHKIHARTPTCSYWGCRRPAAQCDDDHTTAWQRGGLTCECNLSPLCRRHHRMKQREGWRLEQPRPGVLVWRTPGGRTYATTPAEYVI